MTVPGTTPSPEVAAAPASSQAPFRRESMKEVGPFVEKTYPARREGRSLGAAEVGVTTRWPSDPSWPKR